MLGNSVWATSIVLASFMAGLALGKAIAARHADRISRPVRCYALMELIIAATGVALVMGMPLMNMVFFGCTSTPQAMAPAGVT